MNAPDSSWVRELALLGVDLWYCFSVSRSGAGHLSTDHFFTVVGILAGVEAVSLNICGPGVGRGFSLKVFWLS